MELWVRSQDKLTLSKIINFKIESRQIIGNTKEDNWDIYLGTYKTKERALEVLDEIQDILKPKMIVYIHPSEEMMELLGGLQHGKTKKMKNDMEYKEFSTYVYQMPEE